MEGITCPTNYRARMPFFLPNPYPVRQNGQIFLQVAFGLMLVMLTMTTMEILQLIKSYSLY